MAGCSIAQGGVSWNTMEISIADAIVPVTTTLYGKPNCQQCNMTQKYMDSHGIPYLKVDITEDQAAYDHVTSLGYLQAPVVQTATDSWSGFIPDKLASLL